MLRHLVGAEQLRSQRTVVDGGVPGPATTTESGPQPSQKFDQLGASIQVRTPVQNSILNNFLLAECTQRTPLPRRMAVLLDAVLTPAFYRRYPRSISHPRPSRVTPDPALIYSRLSSV
jgi:hypothetical protein